MRGKRDMGWFLLLALALVGCVHGGEVMYDGRSLIINGNRSILFSGSIHYPRSTPQMWPSLIGKAKEGGLDVIDTYVFWNVHEPQPGQYNFEGRYDLVGFLKAVQAQGLYVILRLGPFIESEWRYGGLPFWLHDVPNIIFRTNNDQFESYMQNFTTMIVNMMKAENLFASQGGPIILSQIENEYQNVEGAYHEGGPLYVKWAAQMAVGLNTGVPWVMCKQDDAPDPVINSCNGLNCGETFIGPNSPNKPAIWTENWTQQYEVFGEKPRKRSPQDIAFAVALFVAKSKGCFVNYYMYHGGTNFGRWGSAYVKTSYYDDAPLDEYGLINQPKWGHLKDLHTAIKSCSGTLLAGNLTAISLGVEQTAYVYEDGSGNCVAFLSNSDLKSAATVNFRSMSYELPRRSISILPDCKNVAFNTAKVNAAFSSRSTSLSQKFGPESWEQFKDVIPSFDDTSLKAQALLDQMSTTKDNTDYLWYTFSYVNDQTNQPTLQVNSTAHVLHVFVNDVYSGSAQGKHGDKSFLFEKSISLNNGANNISLLSVMFGLTDSGAYMERKGAGLSSVEIQGKAQSSWGYQVGLVGENLSLSEGSTNVSWTSLGSQITLQRLVWYKANFSAPDGDDPLVLDFSNMGKGEAWVNGNSIGRYWVALLDPQGNPSQTLYHVPRAFLQPTGNQLVLLEEVGGDPTQISLNTIITSNNMITSRACGRLSDSHRPTKVLQNQMSQKMASPNMKLSCPSGKKISTIEFASFGNPSGDCGNYAVGSCHSANSKQVVEKACVGKERCSMSLSTRSFGGDPCPGTTKSLLVVATCA